MEQSACPSCRFPVFASYTFCPNCGAKLKDHSLPTGVDKQIRIYLLSIFLPPFGLVPGIKYLLSEDQKTKMIGITAIALTVISLVITIVLAISVFSGLQSTINSSTSQYSNLGL